MDDGMTSGLCTCRLFGRMAAGQLSCFVCRTDEQRGSQEGKQGGECVRWSPR